MIHVFQMFDAELSEAGQAVRSIATFLRQYLHIKAEREPE
jgi:hypothetical protein